MKKVMVCLLSVCLIAVCFTFTGCTKRENILKIYNWEEYIDESILEEFEDYYFEFDKVEKSSKILLNSNGLFTKNKELFMENSKELPLSIEIFKDDAIVFNDLKSNKISLKSRKSDKSVTMDFSGFPYLGLWTKPTGAPFVCIEPWFGHADYEDFNGDFKDKEGINKLAVGKSFKAAYLVTVQ